MSQFPVLKMATDGLSRDVFEQVTAMEKREYGVGHHREPAAMMKFADAFPEGYMVLMDTDEKTVLGTMDYYPLDVIAWKALADGLIVEEDLSSRAVDTSSSSFYVASIIVAPGSRTSFVGTPMVFRMLMRQIGISLAARQGDLRFVGVGSTPKGKILLENFGFLPYQGSPEKVDMRPRFLMLDPQGARIKEAASKYQRGA